MLKPKATVAPPVPVDLPTEICLSRRGIYFYQSTREDGSLRESPIEYLGNYQWCFTDTPDYLLDTDEYYRDPRPTPYQLHTYQPICTPQPVTPATLLAASTPPTFPTQPLIMTTPASSFKVNKPSTFDGTKTKYLAWKVECQLFHFAHEKDIDTDHKKIISTLSYMKDGLAEKWRVRYVTKTMQEQGYIPVYTTFAAELD